MRPDRIYALIEGKMAQVEDLVRAELKSDVAVVEEMGDYVTSSGGKRIRPALTCLSALACGYSGDKDVRYGVVFEFVHTATLIHDDIIDEAELRRGRKVLHDIYGTTLSILFGDHLYNRAMEMALRDDDFRIVRLICKATAEMIEGEIIQEKQNFSMDYGLDDYMDLIRRKTAGIFASCSETGALLAGVKSEVEEAMRDYGLNLGLAFQIVDDFFDYGATKERIGKPVGSDLNEGKITYPVFLLLERAEDEAMSLVDSVFKRRGAEAGEIERLVELMKLHGVLEDTLEAARGFSEKAIGALDVLPKSKYREALERLPSFVVERSK